VCARILDNCVEITVDDTGIGVAQADIEAIFQPNVSVREVMTVTGRITFGGTLEIWCGHQSLVLRVCSFDLAWAFTYRQRVIRAASELTCTRAQKHKC
jgi:hypothetical protein